MPRAREQQDEGTPRPPRVSVEPWLSVGLVRCRIAGVLQSWNGSQKCVFSLFQILIEVAFRNLKRSLFQGPQIPVIQFVPHGSFVFLYEKVLAKV